MENGRSLVLGSSLSDSEGSELMEGAAAAVGRQQNLSTAVTSSPVLHIVASDCFGFYFFYSSGPVEFQMPSDGAFPQDHTQKSIQAPATKKSTVYPPDSMESALSRTPTLPKQPPALPPKPFTRLPNHITGVFVFGRLHFHCYTSDSLCVHF